MMMRMLEAGGMPLLVDGNRPPDAHNPAGYFEFAPVKRTHTDASWVAHAAGMAVKVVSAHLQHLPAGYEYRVIFMQRRIEEVVASQNALLAFLGEAVPPETPDETAARLGAHVAAVLHWAERQTHMRVLRVDYEAVLHNPAGIAAMIGRFLDVALDTAKMARVPLVQGRG